MGICFRVTLQTAPRRCIWSWSPGHTRWPSSFYCWETDSSKLCSRAMKKSSLGGVDSVLHSRECPEDKGESEEKPSLNSSGCQDILHWGASAFLQPPGAQLAPGSLSSTERASFIRVLGGCSVSAQMCLQRKVALCFCWKVRNGGLHLATV